VRWVRPARAGAWTMRAIGYRAPMIERLLLLALVAACGPSKTDDTSDTGTGEATTDAGSTGTSTTSAVPTDTTDAPTAGDGTTEDPAADYDALSACAVDMVCEEFLHDDGEVMGHGDLPPGFLDVERCILTGLRDGTPGRYIYGVHTYTAAGDGTTRSQFIVHADRSVTFARHNISDFFNPGDPNSGHKESFTAAQTCTISDAAFFDDCFMNHDDESHYPDCMRPDDWWSACAEMGPRCE
jgi:hypothetical protein